MGESNLDPARDRLDDVARWLRVLHAGGGSTAPAISLAPGPTREGESPGFERARVLDVCRRTRNAVDRHLVAERVRSIGRASGFGGAVAPARGALHPTERQAIFDLLRQRLTEIMASVPASDGADGRKAASRLDPERLRS